MIYNSDHPDYIPGSDYIFVEQYEDGSELKRDGDIVLMPQPTDSPNDPLNWPKWRKGILLGIVMFLRGVTCAVADDGFSILTEITKEYPNFNLNSFNTGSGLLFAGIGGWAVLNAPSAYLYGVRISFIVSCVFGIVGNALYSQASSPGMLMGSQFCTGAATAVGESVALLFFAQLCYQHQINNVIGVYVLTTVCATFAGPLIDGYVAENLGWHWVGYIGVICQCAVLILIAFGLQETSFDRHKYELKAQPLVILAVEPNSLEAHRYKEGKSSSNSLHDQTAEKYASPLNIEDNSASASLISQKYGFNGSQLSTQLDKHKSYWQSIQPLTFASNLRGSGIQQYAERLVLFTRVFLFPPVIFGGLVWATQMGFITIYKDVENKYWVLEPWNYKDDALALMMVPNLIGACIGAIYSTWATDLFVLWRARRNNGLKEAETRLWMMLPALILNPLGYFLFGAGTEHNWSWPAPYVALGFLGFGAGCAGEVAISYMADCYPEMVLEGMVGIVFIYTMSSLVICFVAQFWTELSALNTMISTGVIQFAVLFLMFPLIIWGKQCRRFTRKMYFTFVAKRDSLNRD